jgi:hypothetical protein
MDRFTYHQKASEGSPRIHPEGEWVRSLDALRAEDRAEALEDAILDFKRGKINRSELFDREEESAPKIKQAKGEAA